jgi:hypothetical protein
MNIRHGQTPIPLPTIVDDPRWIGRFSREVRKSIAALRDRRIVVAGGQRAAGAQPIIPFRLTARNDDGTIKWMVSSERSSITNGTNGIAYDFGDTGTAWTSTSPKKFDVEHSLASPASKYIVLLAEVDSSLVASNWTLADVDIADAEEVGLDGGSPEAQDEIRLLIGKLTVETAPDPDTVTVSQAVFSQQRTTLGFLNGLEVLVFEPCGINLDDL